MKRVDQYFKSSFTDYIDTHNTAALVTKDYRKETLYIPKPDEYRIDLPTQDPVRTSGSLPLRVYSSVWQIPVRWVSYFRNETQQASISYRCRGS